MDIGDPRRVIIVEPETVPEHEPVPADQPETPATPVREPSLVPAAG